MPSQQFVELSSSTATDRLTNGNTAGTLEHGSIQLSDGVLVFLEASGGNPSFKYGSTDHASVGGTIATVDSHAIATCRDSSDNLYVVGDGGTKGLRGQGFAKGVGYAWTAKTALTSGINVWTGTAIANMAVVWCNTGGGTNSKGHLMAIYTDTPAGSGHAYYAIMDAGALLAGSGTLLTASGQAPTFLGGSQLVQGPCDLDGDGFGAVSGLGIVVITGPKLAIGRCGVSSTGTLNINTNITATLTTGAQAATSRVRCIRYASNAWAILFNSSATSGHYMVARYSSTAQLTAGTDSGAPVNLPLNAAARGWDAFLDPVAATKVWVIAPAAVAAGQQQVYRLGCAVGAGVVWDAAVTADDLLTNTFATQNDIRVVAKPVVGWVDWQAFVQTAASNYALDGDFTAFNSAPAAPTLTSPATSTFQDLTSGSITLVATYNSTDFLNQSAVAVRQKIGAGAYSYWRASDSTWQAAAVWNALVVAPGGSISVTVSGLSNGNVYSWSMASQEVGASLQGPFATDFVFTAQAGPTVVVNAPSGTAVASRPTVVWTPTVTGAEINWRVVIYTAAQYGAGGFVAGAGANAWDSGVITNANTSVVPGVDLVNGTTYRAYMQIAQTGGQLSAWAYSGFTVTFDSPAQPTLLASYDASLNRSVLIAQGRDNLLTLNQSSLETDTTGWAAGANTTIAQSATFALDGSFSLRLTATAGADMSATTPTGLSGVAVSPSVQHTFMAWLRAGSTLRSCTLTAFWYQASGAASGVRASDAVTGNDAVGSWTQLTSTVTSPSDAAFVALVVKVTAAGAAEVHYVDEVSIAPGASTTWTRGGLVASSNALFEYSDDAGATWTAIRGAASAIPSPSESVTAYDYEAIPGVQRLYRTTTQATGPIASIPSSSVGVTSALTSWWLKNPLVTSQNMALIVLGHTATRQERSATHISLGNTKPLVISDVVTGTDGTLTVNTLTAADFASLEVLLASQAVLLLQSPFGYEWYVRLGTPTGGNAPPHAHALSFSTVANPYRTFQIPFVEVAMPATP